MDSGKSDCTKLIWLKNKIIIGAMLSAKRLNHPSGPLQTGRWKKPISATAIMEGIVAHG
jgi:hypothetical protein